MVSISDENQDSLHGVGVEDSEHEIDSSNPVEERVENVESKELVQAITDHNVKLDGVPLAEKEATTSAMVISELVAKPPKTIQSTIPMAPIRPTRPVKTAATAKKTFDLQESLKKSLSYKPHKGKHCPRLLHSTIMHRAPEAIYTVKTSQNRPDQNRTDENKFICIRSDWEHRQTCSRAGDRLHRDDLLQRPIQSHRDPQ